MESVGALSADTLRVALWEVPLLMFHIWGGGVLGDGWYIGEMGLRFVGLHFLFLFVCCCCLGGGGGGGLHNSGEVAFCVMTVWGWHNRGRFSGL